MYEQYKYVCVCACTCDIDTAHWGSLRHAGMMQAATVNDALGTVAPPLTVRSG